MTRSRSRTRSRSGSKSFLLDSIKHVFIINLITRTDRKKQMTQKLKNIGLKNNKITFVSATNRSEESWADALKEIFESNIPINPLDFINETFKKKINSSNVSINKQARGEIAVFLSHLRIWSMVSRLEHGSYLIFEDDAEPTDMLFNKSTDILFKKCLELRVPFIFLGYLFPQCDAGSLKPLKIEGLDNSLISCFVEALHSYIIEPSFGLLVRGSLVTDPAFSPLPINDAVDHFVPNFLIDYQIPFYIFKRPLFNQDTTSQSDIQIVHDDKSANVFKQLGQ